MMKKPCCLLVWLLLAGGPAFSQVRSFADIFPALDSGRRAEAFSSVPLVITAEKPPAITLLPPGAFDFDLAGPVLDRNPSFLVEALQVIPYGDFPAGLAELYYALGRVRDLKGRLYHSATRDENVPLFEDATRIESAKKTAAIADPPRSAAVPREEAIFLRLKDVNFGNSYYRADISSNPRALLYSLSNFRNISYLIFPVFKEGKFIAQFYLEPVSEGLLIYVLAGSEVSDFIASQIHIPSAVTKRLEVFIGWIKDGIGAR